MTSRLFHCTKNHTAADGDDAPRAPRPVIFFGIGPQWLAPLVVAVALFVDPSDEPDLKELVKAARSKDYAVRLAAYDALIELGEPARVPLERVLRAAEKKAADDLLELAEGANASKFRKWLKSEIPAARKEALEIIHDRELYPDDAHGEKGQHLVDNKVAVLRELWRRPSRHFTERVSEVNGRLYYIKEASDYLKRAGFEPEIFMNQAEALDELDRRFDPREFMWSSKERKDIESLLEYNDSTASTATDEERRFVRILNEYRLMLGLKALELDDRLVTASRKHSQEMMDLDYFAHESPVEENRTPGMRADKEGYRGGVLENCAIAADAQGAFDGWYRSSGHHRGLVTNSSSQIGGGHSVRSGGGPGRQWTMLAGSSNSLRGKKAKEDPRLMFLVRREKLSANDVDTRLALARFCVKNDLTDEARTLMEEVVTLDPECRDARELLGHVRSNGRWTSASEKLREDMQTLEGKEAIAAVQQILRSEHPSLRVEGVKAALALGDDALAIIAGALKDDASEVRVAACEALGVLARDGSIPALKGALSDRSFYVAHSAAASLDRLGDSAGIPTLFKGLRSDDLNHRLDAHRKARGAFGKDFGYAWDLPAVERAEVVNRWEAWVQERAASRASGAGGGG